MDPVTPPPASGMRAAWNDLPTHVRASIEDRLGSPVIEATNQSGGFSPGMAARLRCGDGTRVFVKAVGPELNSESPGIHRSEARVARQLPRNAPAPRLRATYDDGEWVALIFDEVDGRMPHSPWRPDELDHVLSFVTKLSFALTPCPVTDVPTARESMRGEMLSYRDLAVAHPDDLDPWEERHLDQLAELGEFALAHVNGDTLVHFDLRADNILVDGERVWFVDWPWALRGAAWIDSLMLLKDAALHGLDPEPHLVDHPLLGMIENEVITGFIAGLAGYFATMSRRPAPPGLPTVRTFQRAQHTTTLAWVRRRTGWT